MGVGGTAALGAALHARAAPRAAGGRRVRRHADVLHECRHAAPDPGRALGAAMARGVGRRRRDGNDGAAGAGQRGAGRPAGSGIVGGGPVVAAGRIVTAGGGAEALTVYSSQLSSSCRHYNVAHIGQGQTVATVKRD